MHRNLASASTAIGLNTRSSMVTKARIVIFIFALIVASNFGMANSSADESLAALCSTKVRKFVKEIDVLLTENPNSVLVFEAPIRKYLPLKGCNVDEIILISRESKFFSEAYDWSPAYTILFMNSHFEVMFGLRKDTGDIEYPAAQTILPTR